MTISEQPAKNHAVNRLEKEITLERKGFVEGATYTKTEVGFMPVAISNGRPCR